MKLYFIPGLGFDRRIFSKLDLTGVEQGYLDWIDPQPGEPISDYARRLSEGISEPGKVALLGHSLGGIVAQEIAALRPVSKVILMSSIRSRAELPGMFKVMRPLGINKLFGRGVATKTFKYWGAQHGYETEEEQDLFLDMVGRQSNAYMRWALGALSSWQGVAQAAETRQIHGTQDLTFPIRLLEAPDHVVPQAGHFMVYKQPDVVAPLIKDILLPGA